MERTEADAQFEVWQQVAALYDVWRAMHRRCENPKVRDYRWYGARGIAVCPRWTDFRTFFGDLMEDIGPRPAELHANGKTLLYSLDRIDVNGNYERGNVRWADTDTQAANRRSTRVLEAVPGQRVGRLVLLCEVDPVKVSRNGSRGGTSAGTTAVRMVLVRCDCGTEKAIQFPNFRTGKTTSCGCFKREKMRELARTRFTVVDGQPGYVRGMGV